MAGSLLFLNLRAVGQSDSRPRKDSTHIGDARFTDMVEGGMVNLGELVRTQHGPEDVVLVGFGSYHGSVRSQADVPETYPSGV